MTHELRRIHENMVLPPLEVEFTDLIRAGGVYRSRCPSCNSGVLLMGRFPNLIGSFTEADHCIGCGRRFIYKDIEYLRFLEDGNTKDLYLSITGIRLEDIRSDGDIGNTIMPLKEGLRGKKVSGDIFLLIGMNPHLDAIIDKMLRGTDAK